MGKLLRFILFFTDDKTSPSGGDKSNKVGVGKVGYMKIS